MRPDFLAVRLENDFFPEGEVSDGVLGIVAISLALLKTVDAIQSDALSTVVVEHFDNVAVGEIGDKVGELRFSPGPFI